MPTFARCNPTAIGTAITLAFFSGITVLSVKPAKIKYTHPSSAACVCVCELNEGWQIQIVWDYATQSESKFLQLVTKRAR